MDDAKRLTNGVDHGHPGEGHAVTVELEALESEGLVEAPDLICRLRR